MPSDLTRPAAPRPGFLARLLASLSDDRARRAAEIVAGRRHALGL